MNWKIQLTEIPGNILPWPARVSVPVPQGTEATAFQVHGPDGSVVAAQSRVIVRWPDGSPRWVQLDFPAGQTGEHVVSNTAAPSTAIVKPVSVRQTAAGYDASVGRLAVTIAPGPAHPIVALGWDGEQVAIGKWQFTATDEAGKAHPIANGPARNVTVEANGPHRFQISWETDHVDRLLAVRFRIELLAGVEGFTLSYQFFHKTPGVDHLKLRGINAEFPLPELTEVTVTQTQYSNLGLRRFARLNHPVTIRVDGTCFTPHVADQAELDDTFTYPHFLRGIANTTGSVVALSNPKVSVIFAQRDFECQRPKTLTVEPGRFAMGIWPAEAGPLVLPQGRSARQVFCFRFCDSQPEAVEALLVNAAAARIEPAIGWLDKADSARAGKTWDQPRLFDGTEPGATWFSHFLSTSVGRWDTVANMFDYGDVPDWGYTVGYPGSVHSPDNRSDLVFSPTTYMLHGMFHTAQELTPVWSNNEYDAIYCLALEAIRTRDASAFRKLIAASRHQIEVDFVHYCDHWQQNRGTPAHSYNHTAGTAVIASHQWTQGLYYYYVLTGDDDVPEVVCAICDFDLLYLTREELKGMIHYFNRELGWAVTALVFGFELTGDQHYRDMARDILHALENYAGRTDFKELEKHCSTSRGLNATGIGLGFVANTVPMGLKCYEQATADPWAAELLREWVTFGLTSFNNKAYGVRMTELFPETLCYFCEMTGDYAGLDASAWHLRLFFRGNSAIGWNDSNAGVLSTKQLTRIYRALVFWLSALAARGELPRWEKALMEVP